MTPANLQPLFHQNLHKSARRGEVQHTGGHEWVTAPPPANRICNAKRRGRGCAEDEG